jgi:hypothetical protein
MSPSFPPEELPDAPAHLSVASAVRASPITAQALPAFVIGATFLAGLPSRGYGRESIDQDPSGLWVFVRYDCAFLIASSPGFIPASLMA